jgi:ribonuclease BN (tRNA processing enzyme)
LRLLLLSYQFHIDPGPGACVRARQFGINPRNNTAIISTHNHLNHAGGLNEILSAMTHDGFDKKGVIIANNTVINGADGYQSYLNNYYKKSVERFINLKVGQKVGVNTIELRAIKAFHSDPDTFGLKIFSPKFTLTYSSDTRYDKELIEEYQNSSVLILNSVFPSGSKNEDQLSLDDAEKIIKEVKPNLCVLTHFGVKMLNADPLYESREMQKRTGVQVIAAKDGMVIDPTNYSANQIQKTLNLYPATK